jgi:hypothetical protein
MACVTPTRFASGEVCSLIEILEELSPPPLELGFVGDGPVKIWLSGFRVLWSYGVSLSAKSQVTVEASDPIRLRRKNAGRVPHLKAPS